MPGPNSSARRDVESRDSERGQSLKANILVPVFGKDGNK